MESSLEDVLAEFDKLLTLHSGPVHAWKIEKHVDIYKNYPKPTTTFYVSIGHLSNQVGAGPTVREAVHSASINIVAQARRIVEGI